MRLLPLLILVAACASEPPCDFAGHTYLLTASTRSGNCGPASEGVQRTTGTPSPGCVRHDEPGEGSCAFVRTQACALPGGGLVETVWALHRLEDDSTYQGILDITITGSTSGSCSGTYNITADRQ